MNPAEHIVAPSSVPGSTSREDSSQSQVADTARGEHRRDSDATPGGALPWTATWVVLMCAGALANSGLVYADDGGDITDDILRQFNTQVNLPAPKKADTSPAPKKPEPAPAPKK